MKTFSPEVREMMYKAANGFCQCDRHCVKKVTEFDHILPNTKSNRKKYPLFLQSPFNCRPINQDCHMQKGSADISFEKAAVYEHYLQSLKGGSHDAKSSDTAALNVW